MLIRDWINYKDRDKVNGFAKIDFRSKVRPIRTRKLRLAPETFNPINLNKDLRYEFENDEFESSLVS